jgi:branched-chain amino acid transport system ATP-binding protein
MSAPLLETRNLVKRFGGLLATGEVSLSVHPGETHALIGPNGAGKTTLIAQLQGELTPSSGAILFKGEDITRLPPHRRALKGLARSFQITSVLPDFTALENVRLAVQARSGHSFRFWRQAAADKPLNAQAQEALERCGLADRMQTTAGLLSHGERRQLELAMALAMKPALLLLDEPMAGMGKQDGQKMTRLLADLKADYAILLVEHDMEAVFSLADRLSVLVQGRLIATGSVEEIRANPTVQAAYLGHDGAH